MPAQSADELLLYDDKLRMLNVTYAAAWELGRLLTIQNRRAFSLLHNWRRQQIHCAHRTAAAASGAPGSSLPHVQCALSEMPAPPPELNTWVDGLRKLQGVPYRYLLPDERLLPMESIRFFVVDAEYISALLDGALSSVRTPTFCPDHCRTAEKALLDHEDPGIVTGLFFRSAAVMGWPSLRVAACRENGGTLDVYRRVSLSPSIALYLFKGLIKTVTIVQGPDIIHLSAPQSGQDSDSAMRVMDLAPYSSGSKFAKARMEKPHTLKLTVNW
jgi:hypothetical protein